MKEHLHNLKCNVTITLPINVLAELDNISDKGVSRNKIVNDAILNYLELKYKISFQQG